jgi:hypothetical protein
MSLLLYQEIILEPGEITPLDSIFIFLVFCVIFFICFYKQLPQYKDLFSTIGHNEHWLIFVPHESLSLLSSKIALLLYFGFLFGCLSNIWMIIAKLSIDAYFFVDAMSKWICYYVANQSKHEFQLNIERLKKLQTQDSKILTKNINELEARFHQETGSWKPAWATFHHTVTAIALHDVLSLRSNILLQVFFQAEIPIFLLSFAFFMKHKRPYFNPSSRFYQKTRWDHIRTYLSYLDISPIINKLLYTTVISSEKQLMDMLSKIIAVFYLYFRMIPFTYYGITELPFLLWGTNAVTMISCCLFMFCCVCIYIMNAMNSIYLLRMPFPKLYESITSIFSKLGKILLSLKNDIHCN